MPRHLRMTVTKGVIIRQRRTDEEKQGIESGARCKGHQDHALLLCSTFANRANTHLCDENRQEAIALINSGTSAKTRNSSGGPGQKEVWRERGRQKCIQEGNDKEGGR